MMLKEFVPADVIVAIPVAVTFVKGTSTLKLVPAEGVTTAAPVPTNVDVAGNGVVIV